MNKNFIDLENKEKTSINPTSFILAEKENLRLLAHKFIIKKKIIAILLCGSHIEGFADEYSDIDLLFITHKYESFENKTYKGQKLSLQFISEKNINNFLVKYDEDYVRWIMNSLILYNNKYIIELRNNISIKSLEIVERHISRCITYYLDSFSAFLLNNEYEQRISLLFALQYIIKALLIANNRYNVKARWLYRQLNSVKYLDELYINTYNNFFRNSIRNNNLLQITTCKFINDTINNKIPMSNNLKKIFTNEYTYCGETNNIINPYLLWIRYPDNSVCIYGHGSKEITLSPIKGYIWQILAKTKSQKKIINKIMEEYNISKEKAKIEVNNFLLDANKYNLFSHNDCL